MGVLAGPRGEVGAAFLVRSLDARVGADELLARRRPETRGPWAAPPRDPSGFEVVERLPSDATTDFAAPGKALLADDGPVDASELRRLERGEPFTPSDVEPEDVDWINDATRPLIHAIPPGEAARLAVAIAEETDAAVASLPP
ncbi:MAG TPA: hypothetical protein VNO79_05915, partial [Actinomycetota bacterium]|nr:hypothetical protein [Actinomycetota bacterium]